MELLQLKYFIWAASGHTLQQAAEQLHVSQSTISMAIKKLEQELQVPLFDRRGRTLQLTEEGKRLLSGAIPILAATEDLTTSLHQKRKREKHISVVVEAIDVAMEGYLCYVKTNPNAQIIFLREEDAQAKLLTRQAHFAITLHPLDPLVFTSHLLLSEPMLLLSSRHSPYADGTPRHLSQLEGETLVVTRPGTAARALFIGYFDQAGVSLGQLMEVGDQETLATYAANGLGVTFIPESVHNTHLCRNHEFLIYSATCPVLDLFCTRNIYLTTLKNTPMPETALGFYTFLTNYLTCTAQLKHFPTGEEYGALRENADATSPIERNPDL